MLAKKAGVGIVIAALAGLAIASIGTQSAWAQSVSDTQKSNYLPNSNIVGADTVNVTDTFERSSSQATVICAGFYIFDAKEQLEESCGCPISEDGLLTIQATSGSNGPAAANTSTGDLVSNPFFFKAGGGAFAALPFANVKLVSFLPNPPSQLNGQDPLVCDATGGTYPEGQYPFPILTGFNNTEVNAARLTLTPSLRAWATHLQNQTNLTESEFRDVPLTQTDANNYAEWCGDIQQIGSGRGVCSCGNDQAL